MLSIGILGPSGTFSEVAAKMLQKDLEVSSTIHYYDTIDLVFKAFSNHDYLILPFENTIDGYVQRTLDLLLSHEGFICKTYDVDVHFSYVYKNDNPKHLYVQFKAFNQCLNFLNEKKFKSLYKTESNVESLNAFKNDDDAGAIIPTHLVNENFPHIHHVADQFDNQTRFIVVKKEKASLQNNYKHAYLVIENKDDYPGVLQNILHQFYEQSFNLTSIMSRPTRRFIGSYHFFIELEIFNKDAFKRLLSNLNHVTLLGLY